MREKLYSPLILQTHTRQTPDGPAVCEGSGIGASSPRCPVCARTVRGEGFADVR